MKQKYNYLPEQYELNKKHKINHSYLVEQFSDYSKREGLKTLLPALIPNWN